MYCVGEGRKGDVSAARILMLMLLPIVVVIVLVVNVAFNVKPSV